MYTLTDFWVYDLTGNEMTKRDIKKAHEYNLIVRHDFDCFYIIGSFNSILAYLSDYIGVELINDYMWPLKNVIA